MKLPSSIVAACLALAAGAPARGAIIEARGDWAAIDRGSSCAALARSVRIAAKGKVQAAAGFSFTPDHRRWGEFHARLSRTPRAGSSVILTIGSQPFLLTSRGEWAWSTGPLQERAIIAAARGERWMRIEARDAAGRRFRDYYSLDGVPTAIDAAAARCSLRGAGKIR